MKQHTGYSANILNQAEALMAKVQADLAAAGEFYQSIGVNPDKIASVVEPLMGPKQRDELAALVAADEAAIDQEVAEELARFRSTSQGTQAVVAKKPRLMI